MPSNLINKAVAGAKEFYPLNEPEIGTPWHPVCYLPATATVFNSIDGVPCGRQDAEIPMLFRPLTIRGTTFKNRIWAVSDTISKEHTGDD